MRLAAIDIGTNSLHMIIVEVHPGRAFEVIAREKEMVRLGAGSLDGRALKPEPMAAALRVLAKFRRLAESRAVDDVVAVATSAVREAENGAEFLDAVFDQAGIRARVISGTEEARLIHRAAAHGLGTSPDVSVLVEVGGGSVEILRAVKSQVERSHSFKLGVIRLTERFVKSDPLSRSDMRALVRHIKDTLGAALDEIADAGFDRVIGTSGTMLSLGAIVTAHQGLPRESPMRHRRILARELQSVRRAVLGLPLEKRRHLPGLDPKRADLVVAGVILVEFILRRLGAEAVTLCDLSLREGVVLDYLSAHPRHLEQVDRYPDARRRTVMELAERCRFNQPHAAQVARLALALFDHTQAIHGLSASHREWLEYAALLHDIGTIINYESHHKHSQYLITNGDLRGFAPDDIECIGLIARYHRRAEPKARHDTFADLSGVRQQAIRTLAALLRLAESLDRSHSQVITGVALRATDDELEIDVTASGDAELELWAAKRQLAPLERALEKPIRMCSIERGNEAAATVTHSLN